MENRPHHHIIPRQAVKAICTIPFPSLQAKQGEEASDWLDRLALNLPLFRKAFQASRKMDMERKTLMEKEALQLLFTTNLSRFLDTVMGKVKATTKGAVPIPDERGEIPDKIEDRLNATLIEYRDKKLYSTKPDRPETLPTWLREILNDSPKLPEAVVIELTKTITQKELDSHHYYGAIARPRSDTIFWRHYNVTTMSIQ